MTEIFKQLHRELAIPDGYYRDYAEDHLTSPAVPRGTRQRALDSLIEAQVLSPLGVEPDNLMRAICIRLAAAFDRRDRSIRKKGAPEHQSTVRTVERIRDFLAKHPLSTSKQISDALGVCRRQVIRHTRAEPRVGRTGSSGGAETRRAPI